MKPGAGRWAAVGLGVLTLTAGTFALATRGMAQAEGQPRREGEVRRDGEPRREGDVRRDAAPRREGEVRRDEVQREERRAQGPDGRPGFPGGGFPGGGFPGGPPMGMMGGATMTATPTTVYVLRGNTLFAFDANTLRLKAKTELPMPEFRPGGPGQPGFPGGPGPGGFGDRGRDAPRGGAGAEGGLGGGR